jgi:hypothetical protein
MSTGPDAPTAANCKDGAGNAGFASALAIENHCPGLPGPESPAAHIIYAAPLNPLHDTHTRGLTFNLSVEGVAVPEPSPMALCFAFALAYASMVGKGRDKAAQLDKE